MQWCKQMREIMTLHPNFSSSSIFVKAVCKKRGNQSSIPVAGLPSRSTTQPPHSITAQSKAPLTTILVVAPPMRHEYNLASSEEQEDEQHAEIEAGVESRG